MLLLLCRVLLATQAELLASAALGYVVASIASPHSIAKLTQMPEVKAICPPFLAEKHPSNKPHIRGTSSHVQERRCAPLPSMPLTFKSMRTLAWSSIAISTVRATYVIDNLSFGQKDGAYISPDLRAIPHWSIQGSDDHVPQILSDRIILTPPYPGNKRGSLWSQDPLHHEGDWTAELQFRASGMDRGGGNLALWYVKDSQAHETPMSLYTAPKFDGLVLVIDQYEGRGGSVRGFLNDGTIDIKSHPDPDTLAFGKCDHAYRNRGILSSIKLHHAERYLEVLIDGQSCFKTDKVCCNRNSSIC